MADSVEKKFGKKLVKVYRSGIAGAPAIYSNDYSEAGNAVLARCAELGCAPFDLVTISHTGWDSAMSPWPSDPVVARNDHFTGEAPEHLEWMLSEAAPFAEEALGEEPSASFIAGYSMAGLFSLWALYQTSFFSGAVSASGSVWFPGFEEYALSEKLACEPRGIHLSIGDRETKVRNPALQHTDSIFRSLQEHYEGLGIPSVFEINQGNHYQHMDLRVAKGITWLLL